MTSSGKAFCYISTFILTVYILYILIFFKTSFSIHHPLEVVLQNRSLGNFLSHPISTGKYESKICPFGKLIAGIFAIWLIYRTGISPLRSVIWSKRFWFAFLFGAALMNPNVLVYIFPAFIFDYICNFTC